MRKELTLNSIGGLNQGVKNDKIRSYQSTSRACSQKEVERILAKLGLSASEAINLFYQEVKRRRGMPFNVSIPNRLTIKTFKDTDAGKDLVRCQDGEDMFAKLGL